MNCYTSCSYYKTLIFLKEKPVSPTEDHHQLPRCQTNPQHARLRLWRKPGLLPAWRGKAAATRPLHLLHQPSPSLWAGHTQNAARSGAAAWRWLGQGRETIRPLCIPPRTNSSWGSYQLAPVNFQSSSPGTRDLWPTMDTARQVCTIPFSVVDAGGCLGKTQCSVCIPHDYHAERDTE